MDKAQVCGWLWALVNGTLNMRKKRLHTAYSNILTHAMQQSEEIITYTSIIGSWFDPRFLHKPQPLSEQKILFAY